MWQDYSLQYEAKLNESQLENILAQIQSVESWKQISQGYQFYTTNGRTDYFAEIDTIDRIFKYAEGHD